MGEWFSGHWFDCIQTLGIVAGFIFSAYTLRKDERARQITNTLEVSDRYGRIWQAFFMTSPNCPAFCKRTLT